MGQGERAVQESGLMTLIRKGWRSLKRNERLWAGANRFRAWLGGVWKWYWERTKPLWDRRWERHREEKLEKGLPVKVVFLCENPAFWKSFETVVTAMERDERFEVILIKLRYRERRADGSCAYQPLDYSDVEERLGVTFLESYDEGRGRWLNLKRMKPDYVFYIHPYDEIRHPGFKVKTVSRYARTCYIPYCKSPVDADLEYLSASFYPYLYYYFLDSKEREPYVKQFLDGFQGSKGPHLACLGYPRWDKILGSSSSCKNKGSFTILWLPRWTTQNGECNFFVYRDALEKYAGEHLGCKLIFRPHPYCFRNFLATKEMTQEELDRLRTQYQERPELELDEQGDYLPSFQTADVLVADMTSLMEEFITLGKPVIYCKRATFPCTQTLERLFSVMYISTSQQDLLDTLDMLRGGLDPLKEKREELLRQVYGGMDGRAGERIRDEIYRDYFETNK